MKRVLNRKMYNSETASRIATNDFSGGSHQYTFGRTSSLYRTQKGNYFLVDLTCWEGEHNALASLSENEAIETYEEMCEQLVDFEIAFPNVEIEEA